MRIIHHLSLGLLAGVLLFPALAFAQDAPVPVVPAPAPVVAAPAPAPAVAAPAPAPVVAAPAPIVVAPTSVVVAPAPVVVPVAAPVPQVPVEPQYGLGSGLSPRSNLMRLPVSYLDSPFFLCDTR